MKKALVALVILSLLSCSCKMREKEKIKEQTIGPLVLSYPQHFKFSIGKGLDSYVAYLTGNKADTFFIEYGRNGIIDGLYHGSPFVVPFNQRDRTIKFYGRVPSDDEVAFSNFPKEDEEQRIFNKNYFMYDTINGILAKIVQPKRIGYGMTGVNFPILKNGMSFSMYANNLDSSEHRIGLQIFKSIHYRDSIQR